MDFAHALENKLRTKKRYYSCSGKAYSLKNMKWKELDEGICIEPDEQNGYGYQIQKKDYAI